jgi:hypothetical protein
MELLVLSLLLGGVWFVNKRDQARRIQRLAGILGQFQVEKMMETVADGYLRALGEKDPERAQQVWNMLEQAEVTLNGQIQSFVEAAEAMDAEQARFSTLAFALPFAAQVFPSASADLRALLRVHRDGVARLVRNSEALSQKDKAFALTAELLLLQHTCHWYCRSKMIASARMVARHRTPHAQLLASVSAPTREAYRKVVG